MGEIYCLYSTKSGLPRYVEPAPRSADQCFKQHITAALELAEGESYDWMRDHWRAGQDVRYYVLQSGVLLEDLSLFEDYWKAQFSTLFNGTGHPQAPTQVGLKVIGIIAATLSGAR